jgi:hypothetical protein
MVIDQKSAIKLYSSCIRQLHQRRERERQGDRRRCSKRSEEIEETRDRSVRSEESWEPRVRGAEKNGGRFSYALVHQN